MDFKIIKQTGLLEKGQRMIIQINRFSKRAGMWLNYWKINEELFCYGLSPADGRECSLGIYPVRLVMSKKFSDDFNGRPMPWIDTDPTTDNYAKTTEHRLIHWGNFLEDTTGCELVGYSQSIKDIPLRFSMDCFYSLYAMIAPAVDTPEGVQVEIREI